MRHILLIGAGRSSSSLIQYITANASVQNWTLTVADVSEDLAKQKTVGHERARAIRFDVNDEKQRVEEIRKSDIVISMLPAHMHLPVAKECVSEKKNLVTASYVTGEMRALDEQAKKNDVLFLNECGLDPGIDHMSAMKIIEEIRAEKGEVISFKSYTGGLVAPESNDNPWGYKFSWNPRNVILAGQGTATYIEENKYRYIPYNRLFTQVDQVHVEGFDPFDGYANRDSLAYRKIYGLENIPTMLRGTLRQKGFCKAWNVFVQLGLTNDSYVIEDSEHLSFRQLTEAFLPVDSPGKTTLERLAKFMNEKVDSEMMQKIAWTGILDDQPIGLKKATPAQILQFLLEQKWKLKESDKDMVVMQHLFVIKNSELRMQNLVSTLVVRGDDQLNTAMAKTVGLPLAIATKLILNREVKLKGVQIPVVKEIYEPILKELKNFGIVFKDETN